VLKWDPEPGARTAPGGRDKIPVAG
jgi:hypothetical protein